MSTNETNVVPIEITSTIVSDPIVVYISIAIAITTAFFLWHNSQHTKKQIMLIEQEMEYRLRPWLGAFENVIFIDPNQLLLKYTNYGPIPTKTVSGKHLISDSPIKKGDILKSLKTITIDLGTIMPNMKQEYRLGCETSQYQQAMQGNPFYLGILIQYTFGKDKSGEYGVVYRYVRNQKIFLIESEWNS